MDNKLSTLDSDIMKNINKIKGRINSNLILNYGISGSIIGIIGSMVLVIVSRFTPIYHPYVKGLYIIAFGVVLGLIIGFLKKYDCKYAALKADSFGLKERAVTAVELIGNSSTFAVMQKEDALKSLQGFDYKRSFPIRANKKYCLVCVGLLVTMGLSFFIPNPIKGKAEALHALKETKKEEVKKVEKLKKSIEENNELTEKQKRELNDKIQKLQQEVKEADDRAKVDKAFEKAEKKLELMQKDSINKNLEKLANSFNENTFTKEISKAIENRQFDELKKNIDKFNEVFEKLNEDQKKALANQMKNLANQINGNPQLNNTVNNLAKALAEGNTNNISQNLNELSKEVSQLMKSDKEFNNAVNNIAKQLGNIQNKQGNTSSNMAKKQNTSNNNQQNTQNSNNSTNQNNNQSNSQNTNSNNSCSQENNSQQSNSSGT